MYNVVFVTVPNKKQAEGIAEGILKDRLCACVNIIQKVTSLFWWEGKIDRVDECLLIIKTRRGLAERLIKKVRALHSYEVPEIICIPIAAGNKKYLEWISESTAR